MTAPSQRASSRKPRYRTEWVKRWCPPKPLVGIQPIERMLLRHAFMVCPESRLVVAVIVRAIGDCLSRDLHRERREARRFLLGPHLDEWCDHVALNPEFVRFVARKAGYLADEKAHWQKRRIRVAIKPPVEPPAEPPGNDGEQTAKPTTNSGDPAHAGL